MKRIILSLLLAPFVLPSCETAHQAAVSTFRVVDAPAAYVRRQLEVDQGPQTTTTTTTETQVYSDTQGYPPSQPYPVQQVPPPPPPVQTQRRIVTQENNPPPAEPRPSATPRLVRSENGPRTQPNSAPRTTSSQNADLPYGKPVPGKPGYVFSPYDKNGGYVDVTGYSPGQKVKDPYTGKVFLVP